MNQVNGKIVESGLIVTVLNLEWGAVMKKAIFLIITIMLVLVGCSNTQESQEELDISAESDIGKSDLDKVKFYATIMKRYDYLDYLLTELNDMTEKLYSIGYKGYELKGYEEGMTILEMYSNGYSKNLKSFQDTIESKDQLLIESEGYEEDLWELEKVYELTDKVMQEHENAYEQIELYIKNDNEQHYEKYNVHRQKCYDLMIEAVLISVENESKYYDMIVNY